MSYLKRIKKQDLDQVGRKIMKKPIYIQKERNYLYDLLEHGHHNKLNKTVKVS